MAGLGRNMIKVGITGQAGFIGSHLYSYLGLLDGFERVPFSDTYFESKSVLQNFVKSCDVIVHFAGCNRHDDPDELYAINVNLAKDLVTACEKVGSHPHIIFASSTQEEKDNPYGRSKLKAREIIDEWAKDSNAKSTGIIIPNVFGPFGRPFYNSVVATFCHQLTHGQEPRIDVDGEIKLIYVNSLIEEIVKLIKSNQENAVNKVSIAHDRAMKVSGILALLKNYKESYLQSGIIPDISDSFETNLFNTFRSFMEFSSFPVLYTKHMDERGAFVELVKCNTGGQFSYSTTKPGITRGNHFHLRKVERFAVIKGKALIQLRRIGTDEVIEFHLDGEQPGYVDMPIWYSHNIKNIGDEELLTTFWINEAYDPVDPDTYFEKV
jgi:UDP-2-acetamido-2,6-beta-L-arabino-hexul-4-ose reductase